MRGKRSNGKQEEVAVGRNGDCASRKNGRSKERIIIVMK